MKSWHFLMSLMTFFLVISCNNGSKFEMVFVEGGDFYIGSTDTDADSDEQSIRFVKIEDFYIGKYEVTQAEWKEIMKKNPSVFKNEQSPVECVSWEDAQLFVQRLNKKTGRHFRLPTMEEWEYAAQGGNKKNKNRYSGSNILDDVGWSLNNSGETTHHVGLLEPNDLGLFDMTGNVHEWCNGMFDSTYYIEDTIMSSLYDYSDIRVFKGGSWASLAKHCRVSNNNYNCSGFRNFTIGLRLAEDVKIY